MEYRQRQAERAAEAEAIARHEAAIALAEANRTARLERRAQIDKAVREREIADLRFQSAQHQAWQRNVDAAARIAVHQRQQQALLADVERHFNPPPPPPDEVVYVAENELGSPNIGDEDFNPGYWLNKPIFRR